MKRALFDTVTVLPFASGNVVDRTGYESAVLAVTVEASQTATIKVETADSTAGPYEPVKDSRIFVDNPVNEDGEAVIENEAEAQAVANLDIDLIGCNTLFGSLSGSSVAASVAIGGVLIPMEEKEGYDKKFAAAVNIASAPTGLIIPPSGILIIYPVLAGCSVVGMIMSGYIPGLMWALACMVVAYVIAKKNHYPTAGKVPASVFFKYFVDAIPSLLLIVIIVGGVMSGIFTATESAAVAVAYTLFLSIVVYRSIKIKDLPKILLDACETTAVIMFLIAGSNVMSFVMSFTGLPSAIGNALISVSSNKYVILLIINLVLLVVGCFMDITPAVLIFTPIFLPVVQSFGMDPIHFGIMMVMNLGIGNITPPVGSALFSGCSVADMDMEDMIKPVLPFYAAIFVALMLVAYVPWFSMALPTLFGAV